MSFLAVGVAGAVAVAGTVATSSIQAGAAKKAAKTQAKSADAALELQREQYAQTRQDIAPWRTAGRRGLTQMQALAQQGPPQFAPYEATEALDPSAYAFNPSAYAFTPPTEADLTRDPSYQFRLKEGQRALERGAAAKGGLLGGGFGRELTRYGQDYASTEYGNVYNRALGENELRYGRGLEGNKLGYGRALTQNEAQMARGLEEYKTRYNVGLGQWQAELAPWKTLAYGGQAATEQLGQLGGRYAESAGGLLTDQGAVRSAGTLAAADAWGRGIQSISNTATSGLGLYSGQYGR